MQKIYQSYGYNNVQINYSENKYSETNTVDINFIINEGEITKINKISIKSNNIILNEEIKSIIKSKTKTITNIFANNNYKPNVVERDKYLIINYFKKKGFLDVNVDTKIEYLKTNKVNIYFNIKEGDLYSFSSINIIDSKEILDNKSLNIINERIKIFLSEEKIFSIEKVKNLEETISSIIFNSGIDYFEIQV